MESGMLEDLDVYQDSVVEADGTTYCLVRGPEGRALAIREMPLAFKGRLAEIWSCVP